MTAVAGLALAGAVAVGPAPDSSSAPPARPEASSRAPASGVYRDGPPSGYTGGFGEPTCRECHFDNPPAGGEGRFEIRGFPEEPVADSVYSIRVELSRPEMERAGFQLAVRRDSAAPRGRSVGRLEVPSPRVQVVTGDDGRVEYAQHTEAGSAVDSTGRTAWTLRWRAPADPGPVSLDAAANAANGDDSEFGDHVYALRLEARVVCGDVDR